jgi:hypothetical protein
MGIARDGLESPVGSLALETTGVPSGRQSNNTNGKVIHGLA